MGILNLTAMVGLLVLIILLIVHGSDLGINYYVCNCVGYWLHLFMAPHVE
jgi:hypothetical protein